MEQFEPFSVFISDYISSKSAHEDEDPFFNETNYIVPS